MEKENSTAYIYYLLAEISKFLEDKGARIDTRKIVFGENEDGKSQARFTIVFNS